MRGYSDLSPEVQEIIRKEVESVISGQGIDWQKFQEIRLSEEKCGPPRYATNKIFDELEEKGTLSLKEGYGVYSYQAGTLINIGPSRNIFGKYNFPDMEELKRYIGVYYDNAQYPIVVVHTTNIIKIL